MAYSYKLSHGAYCDLDDILRYISVDLCSPIAAADFYAHLENAINNICEFPFSGSLVQNEYTLRNDIRKVIVDNYILYYLPEQTEKRIIILRIVYGKRNLDKIIDQL